MTKPSLLRSIYQPLLLILLLVSTNGCKTDAVTMNDNSQQMAWMHNADPQADALAALDKNDFRFMALALRNVVIPGIEQSRSLQIELRCGVILMQGISDTVRKENQLGLMKQAHEYASKYNAVILTRCNP